MACFTHKKQASFLRCRDGIVLPFDSQSLTLQPLERRDFYPQVLQSSDGIS